MLCEKKFKEKFTYEAGDLEFYQKMWKIDPEKAKAWIDDRLNVLIEMLETIKNEMKQLGDISNCDDKKIKGFYNLSNSGRRVSNSDIARKSILDYILANPDRNIKLKELVNNISSLGFKNVSIYNLIRDLVENGSIKRNGHGLVALPGYEDPQL